jgi:hypothetical protein
MIRNSEIRTTALFLSPDPFEDIVMANSATREKAVHRVLLIHKDFDHCIQLCLHMRAQMPNIEAGQFQCTAALPNLCVTKHECRQSTAVYAGYLREVEDDIQIVGFHKRVDRGTESGLRVALSDHLADRESESPLFRADRDAEP